MITIDEVYRLIDEDDTSTIYTPAVVSGYMATYSGLYEVGAAIWAEKAAAERRNAFDVSADGASYTRSQKYIYAVDMLHFCESHRTPTSSKWTKDPTELDVLYDVQITDDEV